MCYKFLSFKEFSYHTVVRQISTILIICFFVAFNIHAQTNMEYPTRADPTRDYSIKSGMTQQEILSLIGAPQEKKENEVKRQELWIYPNSKFLFKEGKLILTKEKIGSDANQFKKNLSKDYNKYINNSLTSKPDFSDSEVRDIFEKISTEGGSSDPTTAGATVGGITMSNGIAPPQFSPPLIKE